jgi:hypothetical protein
MGGRHHGPPTARKPQEVALRARGANGMSQKEGIDSCGELMAGAYLLRLSSDDTAPATTSSTGRS